MDHPSLRMLHDTFEVKLILEEASNVAKSYPEDQAGEERLLNIVGIDEANSRLSVKFGGAPSGTYRVEVSNQDGGFVSEVRLTTEVEVTDFDPSSGNTFGGFQVTITGRNFYPDDVEKNPVKIGADWCLVDSVSATQIKCTMKENTQRASGAASLIVFVSTFEETVCSVSGGCGFTFESAPYPSLDSVAAIFASKVWTYELAASQLDGVEASSVRVLVGGVDQKILSVTADKIVVEIIDIRNGAAPGAVKLYTSHGFAGELPGVALEPKFVGVSTNRFASHGPSFIEAYVPGVGID